MSCPYALRPWRQHVLWFPMRKSEWFTGMCLAWEKDKVLIYHRGLRQYDMKTGSLELILPPTHGRPLTWKETSQCYLIMSMCRCSEASKDYLFLSFYQCKNHSVPKPRRQTYLLLSRSTGISLPSAARPWKKNPLCIRVRQHYIDPQATVFMLSPNNTLAGVYFQSKLYVIDVLRGRVRNVVSPTSKTNGYRTFHGPATAMVEGGLFMGDEISNTLQLYQFPDLFAKQQKTPAIKHRLQPLKIWNLVIPLNSVFFYSQVQICIDAQRNVIVASDARIFVLPPEPSSDVHYETSFYLHDKIKTLQMDQQGRLWSLSSFEPPSYAYAPHLQCTLTVAVTLLQG